MQVRTAKAEAVLWYVTAVRQGAAMQATRRHGFGARYEDLEPNAGTTGTCEFSSPGADFL